MDRGNDRRDVVRWGEEGEFVDEVLRGKEDRGEEGFDVELIGVRVVGEGV